MIQLNRGVSPRHPSGGGKVSQSHAAGSSSSGNAGHAGSGGAGGGGALQMCWHPGNEFEPVPHCGKPPVDGNCGMHGCPVVPTDSRSQRVSSVSGLPCGARIRASRFATYYWSFGTSPHPEPRRTARRSRACQGAETGRNACWPTQRRCSSTPALAAAAAAAATALRLRPPPRSPPMRSYIGATSPHVCCRSLSLHTVPIPAANITHTTRAREREREGGREKGHPLGVASARSCSAAAGSATTRRTTPASSCTPVQVGSRARRPYRTAVHSPLNRAYCARLGMRGN